jgi:hypothetical protein
MIPRLYFRLPPEAVAAWRITAAWALLPLRVPTGWAVAWNGVSARVAPSGEVEFNDSEDLFWATKVPPRGTGPYATDDGSFWREVHIDGGWYRDHFKLVLLDPDWDHIRHRFTTTDPLEFLLTLERWLADIAQHGDLREAP